MNPALFDESFFDVIHPRKNTGSIKYDAKPNGDIPETLIPMWIADMDFQSPPSVVDVLTETVAKGIFGYTDTDDTYDAAVCGWYRRRMGWEILPEWNIQTPGVMFGISAALRALTEPGDSVIICQPVYYPFAKIVPSLHRQLVVSELLLVDGRYEMDIADFETKLVRHAVKLFLFCSPHNPVGRVWSEAELREIGRICIKHHVIIVSDEIHSDFIFDGHRHIPISMFSEELAQQTVTCTSPTKTFNLAGLQAANIIVPNETWRKEIQKACVSTGYYHLNTMAAVATKAVYLHGEAWLSGLLHYLQKNVSILRNAFAPQGDVSLIEPDGTYLMWLDCRKCGLSDTALDALFLEKAEVWLHRGITFGVGGSGFMRMNIACPRSVLETAIDRIHEAIETR